jgi:FixJ family two-component response regulator
LCRCIWNSNLIKSNPNNNHMGIQPTPLIAIVDDDKGVRRGLRNFLRSKGWSVQDFSSGVEFLRSNRVGEFACLITDVRMPELTGPELHKRLVNQSHLIPTIFIAADMTDDVKALLNTSTVVGVFNKPVDVPALTELLSRLLGTT